MLINVWVYFLELIWINDVSEEEDNLQWSVYGLEGEV